MFYKDIFHPYTELRKGLFLYFWYSGEFSFTENSGWYNYGNSYALRLSNTIPVKEKIPVFSIKVFYNNLMYPNYVVNLKPKCIFLLN